MRRGLTKSRFSDKEISVLEREKQGG